MPASPTPREPIRLRLYVAGDSPRSQNALRNLRRLEQTPLSGRFEVEVVDVLADPDRAEADHVLATPTLLRISPAPRQRILGDLGNLEMLIKTLSAGLSGG